MTKLYVALDRQKARYVIRILDPAAARDRSAKKRFFYGGEVIARLNSPQQHPNIVRFVEAGYEGKTPYMVLEYIESRTLRDLILYREAWLTDNVMVFIRQLANVIQFIHSRGFLHLDIKPENILIRPDGRLVLIDFDLALPRKRFFKKLSNISGTAAYVPPETLVNRTADDRADIYAFGICCYEMLTFRKPYEGEKIEQVRAMQIDPRTPPTPIQQYSPRIPAALATLVMKCIAKQPEDRYPDMALVLRDLNALA
ncbi:MAG TPA: serine/threonine protein kinase [Lentisphaerae bacterium]|jgi:serine/threonine protein kinase|nr:serine/threonine protein kinase [Lentisphaerota bacterium]